MTELEKLKKAVYLKLNIPNIDANIERLTFEQLDFITHDINTPCFLEACPGSGKTEVVGIKAAYEIKDWCPKYSGLAILSFTNNAVSEISKRILKYAGASGSKHPHFVGTIDSWIYNYIFLPFAHSYVKYNGVNNDKSPKSIIDDNSEADFLNAFKVKTPYLYFDSKSGTLRFMPILSNKFFFDVIEDKYFIKKPFGKEFISAEALYNSPAFQEYIADKTWLTLDKFNDGLSFSKMNFWKSGFYTFQDIELLSFLILSNKKDIEKRIAKRFPFIIIDECQDLSASQIKLLDILYSNGCKIHYVGDLNQAIYQFRKVNPAHLKTYFIGKNILIKPLSVNFRSNQNIVDAFCKILKPSKPIIGKCELKFTPNCIVWEYEPKDLKDLPKYFIEFINSLHDGIQKNLISIKNCAIIGRSWSIISKINSNDFKIDNIYECIAFSLTCWNKSLKTATDIHQSILSFGNFFNKAFYSSKGSKRNYYCPEGIDSIYWRKFLNSKLIELSEKIDPYKDKDGNEYCWGKWALKVREYITEIYDKLPVPSDLDITSVRRKPVVSGKSNQKISDTIFKENQTSVRVTTIHDVKGETLDAVLLVSADNKRSEGGHFEQWFNENPTSPEENEYKRFGYVAFSRPRHLLILAVPKLKPEQQTLIKKLDFEVFPIKHQTLL